MHITCLPLCDISVQRLTSPIYSYVGFSILLDKSDISTRDVTNGLNSQMYEIFKAVSGDCFGHKNKHVRDSVDASDLMW